MKIIENRKKIFLISAMVIILGFACMIANIASGKGPFNYDVEFAGGTSITMDIGKPFENNDILTIVKSATGLDKAQIQKISNTNQVVVKITSVTQEKRVAFTDAVEKRYSLTKDAVLNTSDVSPTISSEMRSKAILATVISCIAMLIYVSFRFKDVQKGGSAIVALCHDGILVVLTYAILRVPLNYSFIAVILTVLGYSINSTIVIFDRVRENTKLYPKWSETELIDNSVKQTMTRSIYTSLTTLFTVVCLYFLGVQSIKDFALPIIIGIAVGTYSSVFLSGSVWYTLISRKKAKNK